MADNKKSATRTASEMKEWYKSNKRNIENFAKSQEIWKQVVDPTKSSKIKNINRATKDNVLNYLQNPANNESNLRMTSNYLYYRSHVYMKLVDFFANMFMPNARTVIPDYSINKKVNMQKNLKAYSETIDILSRMNLDFYSKIFWTTVLKEDVYFGIYWLDDTGFTVINIPADYGKIDGIYNTGNFSWSLDMSFFTRHSDFLEWWGEPFKSMYSTYEKTGQRWQRVPSEHSVAFKFRSEDIDIVIPPFAGLFGKFADLEDMSDYAAIQAEQDIYKFIWMEMETISGSKMIDDWKVDPETAQIWFDRMNDKALPDYTASAMVPGKLNTISFNDDASTQTNRYDNAMKSILDIAGGSQVLYGSGIRTSAAFEASMIAAENFALSSMLPQFSSWIKMVLIKNMKKPCSVKFHKVSPYSKARFMNDLLTGSQNGVPDIMTWNTLNGFDERETLALNSLQEELGIPDKFKPVSTSYTQSGNSGEIGQGAPEKDATVDGLTESGERDRNG